MMFCVALYVLGVTIQHPCSSLVLTGAPPHLRLGCELNGTFHLANPKLASLPAEHPMYKKKCESGTNYLTFDIPLGMWIVGTQPKPKPPFLMVVKSDAPHPDQINAPWTAFMGKAHNHYRKEPNVKFMCDKRDIRVGQGNPCDILKLSTAPGVGSAGTKCLGQYILQRGGIHPVYQYHEPHGVCAKNSAYLYYDESFGTWTVGEKVGSPPFLMVRQPILFAA
jgi:hypothetical protein